MYSITLKNINQTHEQRMTITVIDQKIIEGM